LFAHCKKYGSGSESSLKSSLEIANKKLNCEIWENSLNYFSYLNDFSNFWILIFFLDSLKSNKSLQCKFLNKKKSLYQNEDEENWNRKCLSMRWLVAHWFDFSSLDC
jgi:hypothetical protein